MGKRMDDWLRNMGDWNISRRRYYGLPLPFYPCGCGHLNVIGSQGRARGARNRGLRPARGAAPSVDRPRPDPLRAAAARPRRASPRSATSGSTRASSRSRRSAGRTRSWSTRGTRPAPPRVSRRPTCRITRTGRSGSPPTGSRRCASRSGSGSTRSSSCRSSLVGRAPYQARARLREDARRARPRDARARGGT